MTLILSVAAGVGLFLVVAFLRMLLGIAPVSYTHLDVYKRQLLDLVVQHVRSQLCALIACSGCLLHIALVAGDKMCIRDRA